VLWVLTEATAAKPGRRMPLDANPANPTQPARVDGGNVVVLGADSHGTPVVRVVANGAGRHRSHFATCPRAKEHRRAR
jgi:hypothetical protein